YTTLFRSRSIMARAGARPRATTASAAIGDGRGTSIGLDHNPKAPQRPASRGAGPALVTGDAQRAPRPVQTQARGPKWSSSGSISPRGGRGASWGELGLRPQASSGCALK